jgi:hypothetical protein
MWHWPDRRAATIARAFCLGLVAANLLPSLARTPAYADDAAPAAAESGPVATHILKHARFTDQTAPDAVRHMADWVVASGNNGTLPFVIIDKPEAKVVVFDGTGQMLGSAWVLIGLARGDDSVPGIGTMPLTAITPDMRTTPAGRFVATIGHDLGKLDVLWVDYPDAISLHRVINTDPAERRLERIVSPTPADHRISYGCINVPAKFFDSVVDPTFKGTAGIVYILPEVKEMRAVFPTYYDVDGGAKMQALN